MIHNIKNLSEFNQALEEWSQVKNWQILKVIKTRLKLKKALK